MSLYSQNFYRLLYAWYDANHRVLPWRETDNPYYIWLSEVILQQTRVAQGMDYYDRFVRTYPTIDLLAAADEDEVLRLWQGLGYYSRARNLHKAAKMIVERQTAALTDDRAPTADRRQQSPILFPQTFAELRALPGVGEYTAGAIASFAYDQPYPALDGNVYRVLARLFDCEIPFDTSSGKKHFHRLAEELLDREHPRQFNSAIMEFGALHCLPVSPDCANCPLQAYCRAFAAGTAELLPVRKPRPTLRDRFFTYNIYITPARTTLIRQRTDKDIWHHLYEFPLTEHPTEAEWLNDTPHPSETQTAKPLPTITHILSHQRLHVHFYLVATGALPDIPGTIAVRWEDLDDYALSRLTLKALESIQI